MISGIYTITHSESGRFYIGSARDIHRRFSVHRYYLRRGRHQNSHLQRSWEKHGEAAFLFAIAEICDEQSLIATEQRWIDSYDPGLLFNQRLIAHVNRGVQHTLEERERIRRRSIDRGGWPPASRIASLEARRRNGVSEQTRQKRSRSLKGHKRSEHEVELIRRRMLDRSPEQVEAQRQKLLRTWLLVSPSGEEFHSGDLPNFAEEHNLCLSKLYAVAKGRRSHHKNWRCTPAAVASIA